MNGQVVLKLELFRTGCSRALISSFMYRPSNTNDQNVSEVVKHYLPNCNCQCRKSWSISEKTWSIRSL